VDANDASNPGFLRAVVLRRLVPGLLDVVPRLGKLFALADLLAIFTKERRCILDCMAGTKVVAV
jgi:hypothetical protein